MIHNLSDVQSNNIGKNTNIWQFCVILPNAQIGDNCNICSNCFIENDVKIGNNVTIKNGVSIYDGITIEDNVFIGPNVSFCNDRYPKSKNKNFILEPIVIKEGASIGANATILPGVTIGKNSTVAAGAIVTKDISDNVIYITKAKTSQSTKYKIILKADDLSGITQNVLKLDKIIEKENIYISWGIIGKSLKNPSEEYINFLKTFSKKKNYHFFNHGYLHLCGPEYEFFNKSKDEQYNYIKQTQDIVKEKTGITLDTFGAPCNHIDENTTIALENFPEIKNWYYGFDCKKNNFIRTVNIEETAGNPNYKFFKNAWTNCQNKPETITLQIHPNMWTSKHFNEFKKIIKFLKSKNCIFITIKDLERGKYD